MNPNMLGRMQQIGQLMRSMKNPQQAVLQLLSNNSNPMAKQMLEMAKNGNTKGIEEFARNVAKEKGINYDESIQSIKDNLGL